MYGDSNDTRTGQTRTLIIFHIVFINSDDLIYITFKIYTVYMKMDLLFYTDIVAFFSKS